MIFQYVMIIQIRLNVEPSNTHQKIEILLQQTEQSNDKNLIKNSLTLQVYKSKRLQKNP